MVGCSTGEEVYSLAISILEQLGETAPAHPILVFGTDLSEQVIEAARAGFYPDAAVRGLGEERLRRFFTRTDRGWRVAPALRERCVFARHDVARDPPFSKLDLVSCRNVLIYFGQALQRRVLAVAHYCLNQPGYLLLGRSESASGVPRWFAPVSAGGRLFRRRPGPSTFRFAAHAGPFPFTHHPAVAEGPTPPRTDAALARHVDDLVLARYAPPGVLVNERLEVVQYRGKTGPYLEAPPGEPQSLILKLARPGLSVPLRVALAQARQSAEPVRKERVPVDGDEAGRSCDLLVIPVDPKAGGEGSYLVLFEERPRAPAAEAGAEPAGQPAPHDEAARLALEEELTSTKAYLAVLLEEHGRGTDALATSNDELVSGNEELQSLNEELETAKEELQASNEELTTVNDELHHLNHDLQLVNADVLNLLDTVELPILILDGERRIRRFTGRASTFMGLTPADVGRRIDEVDLPVLAPDLESWIARAMERAILVEAEVQDGAGRWLRLQVRPHRAVDGSTDGAILTLVDIDALRHEVIGAQWARDYARSIVEAVQVPLVVLDAGLRVLSANAAYHGLFGDDPAGTEGQDFFELGTGAWETAALHRAVAAVRDDLGRFQGLVLEREVPGAGRRVTSVSGCAVPVPGGQPMVLLSIEDVTERQRAERHQAALLQLAEEARRRAERADGAKDVLLGNLSHELRTPLTTILLQAELLQAGRLDPDGVNRAGAAIEANTKRQVQLVEDLLDASRSGAGKLVLSLEAVDWRTLVASVVEASRAEAAARSVGLELAPEGGSPHCEGDAGRLKQVVGNLVGNAIKFTPRWWQRAAAGGRRGRRGAPGGGRHRARHGRDVPPARLRAVRAGGDRRPGRRARPRPRHRAGAGQAPRRRHHGDEPRPRPRLDLHRHAPSPGGGRRDGRGCRDSRSVKKDSGARRGATERSRDPTQTF